MAKHSIRSEETRSRILEAAGESFADHGYDGTGVAEICTRAGISKGALYHHFTGKQHIFLELLDEWIKELQRALERIRSEAGSVPEAIFNMVAMTSEVFQATEGQVPLFLEFLTKAVREPEIWHAAAAPYKQFRSFFSHLVRDGIEEGSLKPVDPEEISKIIVSFAVGLVIQGVFDPFSADWVKVGQEGMRIIIGKLQKE